MVTEHVNNLQDIGSLLQNHGLDMLFGLFILIVGILAIKWIMRKLKNLVGKVTKNTATSSIISNSVGTILLAVVILASGMKVGAEPGPLIVGIVVVGMAVIGLLIIFRPLIPTLPFQVGNTVKVAGLLGKIEAMSFLNTRMKTFDGRTFFVPNRKILDELVMNYHFTKTRRVKVDVSIRYDQDLAKAKRVLEAVMIADPRVLAKPSPQVYVLKLAPSGVDIGGRCWVDNTKYWFVKCDLLEKTKFRFDNEGILFAYPQLDIHHHKGDASDCHAHPDIDESQAESEADEV